MRWGRGPCRPGRRDLASAPLTCTEASEALLVLLWWLGGASGGRGEAPATLSPSTGVDLSAQEDCGCGWGSVMSGRSEPEWLCFGTLRTSCRVWVASDAVH